MIHRHILKLNSRYVGEILSGRKRFEVRNNDRSFQRGDEVQFSVIPSPNDSVIDRCSDSVNPKYKEIESKVFRITFVVTGYGLMEGYCVFGFEEIEE